MVRCALQPLDQLIWQQVCSPLGLKVGSSRQWLAWDPDFLRSVAPTERVAWRGGLLAGVVHDENAWAYAGHATAGHAGLFGSAAAVAGFGAAILDVMTERRDDWLDRAALEHLVAPRPGGTLRAGFDGVTPGASAAGTLCGPHTFGHLGFTGTSFWCEPAAECVTVLLTNRVNLGRHHLAIREARPLVHDRLHRLALEIRTEGW
jgi:CubicO group peptidase (beta-lactamase class C family)